MAFVKKSTLTYPATNSFPVRQWLDIRDPVSGIGGDFRNFGLFDIWINEAGQRAWIMVERTATLGTWIQMASSGTGIITITGDVGGAVGADGANNINLLSGAHLTVTGNPGANTLTITLDGDVAEQYDTDTGSAIPAAGVLNIVGMNGITTSGSSNTVTIDNSGIIPVQFDEDAGTATPVAGIINFVGGTGINTAGFGNIVTINSNAEVATTYTEDTGVATPVANNLNILGGTGIATTGTTDIVTIEVDGTIADTYTADTGTATPALNNLNVIGGTAINTLAATDTLTINADATIATTYTADSGSAIPALNNLNIVGSGGVTTSGAGSTLTINGSASAGGQVKFILDNTQRDITAVIPYDNTIPQQTEGEEVMQVTITPSNANSILEISSIINAAPGADSTGIIALFRDAISNALIAESFPIEDSAQSEAIPTPHSLKFYVVAESTSSTTFKIRLGSPLSGSQNIYYNRESVTPRNFGGVRYSSLSVTELSP